MYEAIIKYLIRLIVSLITIPCVLLVVLGMSIATVISNKQITIKWEVEEWDD